MRGRWLLVVAVATALLGAPSRASATGNELSGATATPASGTTATPFVLAVEYQGRFPALSVVADVAGVSLPMALVAGSSLDGSWSVTTTIPAGTWSVAFAATSERGNSETLVGPTLIATDATPTTIVSPTPMSVPEASQSPAGHRRSIEMSTSESAPPPSSPANAAPTGVEATPSPAPAVSESAVLGDAAPGEGAPAAAAATAAAPESTAPGSVQAPASSAGTAVDDTAQLRTESSLESALLSDTPVEVDPSPGTPIVVGLVGLAAIGLLGARLILLGRRRRSRDDARAATAVAADTSAALERRTLRRARVRLSEDPVISALGIPTEREQRPRRRRSAAGRVDAGQPGQPPT